MADWQTQLILTDIWEKSSNETAELIGDLTVDQMTFIKLGNDKEVNIHEVRLY